MPDTSLFCRYVHRCKSKLLGGPRLTVHDPDQDRENSDFQPRFHQALASEDLKNTIFGSETYAKN